jgi:hypothetical protein
MKNKIVTSDFGDFGYRERALAAELLSASIQQGFPDDFEDNGVQIMMNTNSGQVFFTNSDFEVCAMNEDKLESRYFTVHDYHEGFASDLNAELDQSWHIEDVQYLLDAGIIDENEFNAWVKGEMGVIEEEDE